MSVPVGEIQPAVGEAIQGSWEGVRHNWGCSRHTGWGPFLGEGRDGAGARCVLPQASFSLKVGVLLKQPCVLGPGHPHRPGALLPVAPGCVFP